MTAKATAEKKSQKDGAEIHTYSWNHRHQLPDLTMVGGCGQILSGIQYPVTARKDARVFFGHLNMQSGPPPKQLLMA